MITLNNYLIEALSNNEMKLYLINKLQTTDLDDKTLSKAYDIVAKSVGDELLMKKPDPATITTFSESRAISQQFKKIRRAFREYDSLNVLYGIINDTVTLPSAKEVFKNYSSNIIDFYKSYNFQLVTGENVKLNPELIYELATEYAEKDKHGITRGDFEILCCLLLRDLNTNNEPVPGHHKGDINTGTMGSLEFKCNGGRLMGQTIESPELIDKAIIKVLTEKKYNFNTKTLEKIDGNNKGIFSKGSQFTDLKNYLDSLNVTEDDLIDILAYSLTAQFVNLRTDTELNEIKNIIKKDNMHSFDTKSIPKLLGSIDLYYYQKIEKCDYMIVFHDKKDGRYIKLDNKILSSLKNIYNNKDISFTSLPRNSKNNREAVMQIHYK